MTRLCKAYLTICFFCAVIIASVLIAVFGDFNHSMPYTRQTAIKWPQASYVSPYLLLAAERLGKWEYWEENRHVFRFFIRLDLGEMYDDILNFLNERDFYGRVNP